MTQVCVFNVQVLQLVQVRDSNVMLASQYLVDRTVLHVLRIRTSRLLEMAGAYHAHQVQLVHQLDTIVTQDMNTQVEVAYSAQLALINQQSITRHVFRVQ